jgi:choline kinase
VRAIILAAGRGTRLMPHTTDLPKCLLRFDDERTILDVQLQALAGSGLVDAVTVVGGHRVEALEAHVRAASDPGVDIEILFNPFYDVAGPLGSLWTALPRLERDDVVLLNGDTVFTRAGLAGIVRQVSEPGEGTWLAVTRTDVMERDDMLVCLADDGRVLTVGKELNPADVSGVSAGLLIVRGDDDRAELRAALRRLLQSSHEAKVQWPWHSVLNLHIGQGKRVAAVAISRHEWHEIDSFMDLHRALEQLDLG